MVRIDSHITISISLNYLYNPNSLQVSKKTKLLSLFQFKTSSLYQLQNNFFPLHHSLSIFLNSHNLKFPLSKVRLHLHSPLFDLQLVLKASLLSDSSYKVHFSQLAIIFIIVIIASARNFQTKEKVKIVRRESRRSRQDQEGQ